MQESRYCRVILAAIGLLALAVGLTASLAPFVIPSTILAILLAALGAAILGVFAASQWLGKQRNAKITDSNVAEDLESLREDLESLRLEHLELLEDKAYLQFVKSNQERERQLLALDLHDLVLPNLTSSLLQLEAILDRPHTSRESLEMSIEMIRTSLRHARRTMNLLSPNMTQDEGVVAGIQRLIEQFAPSIESILFRQDIEFDRLTPMAEGVLVQLVRETLDEIRQCSTTDTVVIDLRQNDELLQLSITSNGTPDGKTPFDSSHEGRIQECVEYLNGTIERRTSSELGCELCIEFPLDSAMKKFRNREKSRAFG